MWAFVRDTLLGGSLWFTCALAVSELLLLLLLLSRNKNLLFYIGCSVCLAIAAIVISNQGILIFGERNIPWFYKSGMIATLYLTLGGLFWKIEHQLDKFIWKWWICLPLLYFLVLYVCRGHIRVNLNACDVNMLGLTVSVLGIVAVIYVFKHIREFDLLHWIGRHTLGLYFLSGGIPNVFAMVALKSGIDIHFAQYLIFCVLAFLFGMIGTFIIDKYVPFVFDIRNFSFNKIITR